ncbi:MAG: hypothetical protein OXE05_00330 [Chloroflexi bacterium]|nr:hypothetical protein [Chloroflexota bacterium]
MVNVLGTISKLKREPDELRPLPPTVLAQVEQKLRLEANYHSNAIEGNTLTLGETRSLILHGLTAHGKPMRDHLDIQGHDSAVQAIEDAEDEDQGFDGALCSTTGSPWSACRLSSTVSRQEMHRSTMGQRFSA